MSLADFHVWAKEVVRVACENALTSEGFVPDPVEEQRAGRNNKVRNNAKKFDIGIRNQAKGSRERISMKSLVVVIFLFSNPILFCQTWTSIVAEPES